MNSKKHNPALAGIRRQKREVLANLRSEQTLIRSYATALFAPARSSQGSHGPLSIVKWLPSLGTMGHGIKIAYTVFKLLRSLR